MTQMKTSHLPKGMALVETADGRWFPAIIPLLTDTPYWVTLLEAGLIPPAREPEPCHDPKRGYNCREKALAACCAWEEEVMLPVQWDILAAHTEVYPEHNAWYREEIAQMTGGGSTLVTCTIDVTALVIAEVHPRIKVIEAAGVSPDEAVERLYQKVYVWWCAREQESARASSPATAIAGLWT